MDTDTQPTSWEVPDDVWRLIEQVLNDLYSAKPKGHRRVDLRRVLNGIIVRRRTGGPWNPLPQQFGDDSTVHRHFQRWCTRGVFAQIWTVLVQEGEELGGVNWQWQSADAALGKARFGGTSLAPSPRSGGRRG
jgi:putative transposase